MCSFFFYNLLQPKAQSTNSTVHEAIVLSIFFIKKNPQKKAHKHGCHKMDLQLWEIRPNR